MDQLRRRRDSLAPGPRWSAIAEDPQDHRARSVARRLEDRSELLFVQLLRSLDDDFAVGRAPRALLAELSPDRAAARQLDDELRLVGDRLTLAPWSSVRRRRRHHISIWIYVCEPCWERDLPELDRCELGARGGPRTRARGLGPCPTLRVALGAEL
jgi:hypothetical protein